MNLSKEATQIVLQEQVVESVTFGGSYPVEQSVHWTAQLQAEDENGWEVAMTRSGRTPDEALRILFEAMGDAGIEL